MSNRSTIMSLNAIASIFPKLVPDTLKRHETRDGINNSRQIKIPLKEILAEFTMPVLLCRKLFGHWYVLTHEDSKISNGLR